MNEIVQPGQVKPKKKLKWYHWVLIIIGGLIVLGLIIPSNPKKTTNQPEQKTIEVQKEVPKSEPVKTEPEIKPIKITASDLFNAFDKNEIAANAEYKDKIVELTGVIEKLSTDFLNTPYISLKTDKMFYSVQASLNKSQVEKAAKLNKGDKVVLTCRVTGMIVTSVMADDCIIN